MIIKTVDKLRQRIGKFVVFSQHKQKYAFKYPYIEDYELPF